MIISFQFEQYINISSSICLVSDFKDSNKTTMFNLKVIFLVFAIFQFIQVNSSPVYDDLDGAATDHDYGRVQIKVFRGPTEHHGHDYFAPWGYWVKQPADEDHH